MTDETVLQGEMTRLRQRLDQHGSVLLRLEMVIEQATRHRDEIAADLDAIAIELERISAGGPLRDA